MLERGRGLARSRRRVPEAEEKEGRVSFAFFFLFLKSSNAATAKFLLIFSSFFFAPPLHLLSRGLRTPPLSLSPL